MLAAAWNALPEIIELYKRKPDGFKYLQDINLCCLLLGMKYNNRNIVLSELIGLRARIVDSLDKKQKGITGNVIDETKNTVIMETAEGKRSFVKMISRFRFYTPDGSFEVEGKEIDFRPDERIEKAMKYYKRRKE
jgi:ribonuclease P protein subunit POP4